MRVATAAILGTLAAAGAARADGLVAARAGLREGRFAAAANRLFAEEGGGAERELLLAQALQGLGMRYGAFFHAAQVVRAGPAEPGYLEAVLLAGQAAAELGDEVVAPNLLRDVPLEVLAKAPAAPRAGLAFALALFESRAGRPAAAQALLALVPPEGPVGARARMLEALLRAPQDPASALPLFRAVAADEGAPGELRDLAHLNAARALFALQRYPDAAAEDERIARFSRHWDEALFEGAWASFRAGDGGAALGKLHALHSPHLSDQFVPESETLTALVYHDRCLHPQARAALDRAARVYGPQETQLAALLDAKLAPEAYLALLEPGDARLPFALQHHLVKNERIDALRTHLARLEAERARVKFQGELSLALAADLTDLLDREHQLVAQLAGKFVRGRLEDALRLLRLLSGEAGIVRFETAKSEKLMLEKGIDARPRLAAQVLERPAVPGASHEYWPFDGEYWPDEIGYYRYTLKDACVPGAGERP